jgi:hypothetical protein
VVGSGTIVIVSIPSHREHAMARLRGPDRPAWIVAVAAAALLAGATSAGCNVSQQLVLGALACRVPSDAELQQRFFEGTATWRDILDSAVLGMDCSMDARGWLQVSATGSAVLVIRADGYQVRANDGSCQVQRDGSTFETSSKGFRLNELRGDDQVVVFDRCNDHGAGSPARVPGSGKATFPIATRDYIAAGSTGAATLDVSCRIGTDLVLRMSGSLREVPEPSVDFTGY